MEYLKEEDVLPLYIISDSTLLFHRNGKNKLWVSHLIEQITNKFAIPTEKVTASYIGVNNGDEPGFFEIFQG